MILKINNVAPLNEDGCSYWASMPYWHFSDILFLSMGFDPSGINRVEFDEETASKLGHDFGLRFDLLRRALDLNQIDLKKIPSEVSGGDTFVFPPEVASNWAIKNLPSFPTELSNAVMQRFKKNTNKTKTSPAGRRGYYFYGLTRLNQESCTYWAAMNYWNDTEALLLSMGYDPNGAEVETDDKTAWEIGNEFCRRDTMLSRAYELQQIETLLLDAEDTKEKQIVYLPEEFSRWASVNLLSFPQELLNAVRQHKLKSTPSNDFQYSNQQFELTMLKDSSSSSDIQGTLCSVNPEPASGVSASDLSHVSAEKPLKGNRGSDWRWSKRDEIVDIAVDAMRFLVDACHCKCRHDILANIVYEHGNDSKSFKELDAKGYNLLKQFKMAALKIVPEDRQFGNDHNPNKSKKYDPEACKCEIHDHKNFKPQK